MKTITAPNKTDFENKEHGNQDEREKDAFKIAVWKTSCIIHDMIFLKRIATAKEIMDMYNNEVNNIRFFGAITFDEVQCILDSTGLFKVLIKDNSIVESARILLTRKIA